MLQGPDRGRFESLSRGAGRGAVTIVRAHSTKLAIRGAIGMEDDDSQLAALRLNIGKVSDADAVVIVDDSNYSVAI